MTWRYHIRKKNSIMKKSRKRRHYEKLEKWRNGKDFAKNERTVEITITLTSGEMMDTRLFLYQKVQITYFSKLERILNII